MLNINKKEKNRYADSTTTAQLFYITFVWYVNVIYIILQNAVT